MANNGCNINDLCTKTPNVQPIPYALNNLSNDVTKLIKNTNLSLNTEKLLMDNTIKIVWKQNSIDGANVENICKFQAKTSYDHSNLSVPTIQGKSAWINSLSHIHMLIVTLIVGGIQYIIVQGMITTFITCLMW